MRFYQAEPNPPVMGRQISVDCTLPNCKCEVISAAWEVNSGRSIAVLRMTEIGASPPSASLSAKDCFPP